MMILGLGAQIVFLLWNIGVAISQITGIGNEKHTCSGERFDFNWNYTSADSILIVEWNVNVSTNIATRDIGGSQPFTPNSGYTTRLTQISEVGIALSSLSESDYGEYGCTVSTLNGNAEFCPPLTLFVYDPWSEVLSISKTGGGDSVLLQSSINDDRTSYSWIYKDKEVGSGFKYKATENGNYTLALGKRGQCLSGSTRESIIVAEILGLTPPSSTINSDMSTVSEPLTMSSNISTTVTEVSPPQVNTLSAGLSQEILITIISSSILALGVLILLIVLVVKQCRQKNRETPAKNKENHFATKQGNFTKKDALKSSTQPRIKLSGKRNTKQESISLDKFEHTQFNNSQAPKDRMYEHYPETTDYMYWNNSGNQHVFNHSHTERNMIKYGYQHDRYPKSLSGPNNRMMYQSCYPEHPRHNEGMFQYYRADKLYQEQQMYQMPFVAQYDDYSKIKPENKRFEERTYERNWDFLY